MDNTSNFNRTIKEQRKVEEEIKKIFDNYLFDTKNSDAYEEDVFYEKTAHFNFAKKMINTLPGSYGGIDAGMPWFSYWILNILDLCSKNKTELSVEIKLKFVQFLRELQHPDGGFSGYAGGLPHIVSNYAAIMTIIALDIKEAYELVDREKMKSFLKKMKYKNKDNIVYDSKGQFLVERGDKVIDYKTNWPGAFLMHVNGESDLRATYCGITVAFILNIIDDELTEGVVENIIKCQTFEGGFGPEPLCEAHGGYSYCAIATLVLLNRLEDINVNNFIRWLVNRQMSVEGGFQGRTNKLVDSCYSFWQGSIFNLLSMADSHKYTYDNELLYDQLSLQAYILFACQYHSGGLVDKPGKRPDLFHTNYATAGLSLSQKCFLSGDITLSLAFNDTLDLEEINPIYCVSSSKVDNARDYYWNLK